jgi:hypothetical protein
MTGQGGDFGEWSSNPEWVRRRKRRPKNDAIAGRVKYILHFAKSPDFPAGT